VFNPATGEEIAQCVLSTVKDVDAAVSAARQAWPEWRRTTGATRADYLRKLGAALEAQREEFSLLETLDNGKPLEQSRGDIDFCVEWFKVSAEIAEDFDKTPRQELPTGDPSVRAYQIREAVGPVGLITPWNYPLMQSVAKVAGALAAGCTMVLKPSSVCPLTSLRLGDLALEAGLPSGVLNCLSGSGSGCGNAVASHKGFSKVSFTGSSEVGATVAQNCTRNLVAPHLELGGKGAIVVFDDVDVARAVDWIMFGVFLNAGQICSATTRLLVHEKIADRLIARLVEETKKLRVGDPTEDGIDMGPMVSAGQQRLVRKYFELAAQEAEVLAGGNLIEGPGYFVEPTVLRCSETSALWTEEIFGPVLSVRTFASEEEGLRVANDCIYGLANAVLTADPERATRFGESLEAGINFINCNNYLTPWVPFGGIKLSGFGKEFGREGVHDYTHNKIIVESKPSFTVSQFVKAS